MTTAYCTTQPPATLLCSLTDIAIAYLDQQACIVTMPLIEAMVAALAAFNVDDIEDVELRYSYLVATSQPVGFSDLPPSIWPNW